METKICNKCGMEKFVDEFSKWNNACKTCKNKQIKEWKDKNKESISKKKKKYYENNYEHYKKYRDNNKEKISLRMKIYDNENKEKIRIRKNEYVKTRMKLDYLFKLKENIKNSIRQSFKRNNFKKECNTIKILGCSFYDLKLYIESRFEPWMTWDNYGLYNGEKNFGWDIDHIIPTSIAINENDIIKLNHYTNLQPLCSYVNRYIKSNKRTTLIGSSFIA